MMLRRLLLVLLAGLSGSLSVVRAGEVTIEKGTNTAVVRIDGLVLTTLHTAHTWKKPFFYPVTAAQGIDQLAEDIKVPSGEPGLPGSRVLVCRENAMLRSGDQEVANQVALDEILEVRDVKRPWLWVPEKNAWIHESDVAPLGSTVTRVIQTMPTEGLDRAHPLYYDHPHHKGIWFSIDEVNEIRYWAEKGIIRNESVTIDEAKGESACLTMVNHWLDVDESTPLLKETAKVRIFANRTMVFDYDLAPVSKPVTFRDTKEGLFGIRLPNSMRETHGGGPVENADGLKTTANCWGKTSAWVDYAGPVGKRDLAVTIFDHPGSFKKSRYHVRDYGLFSVSPFGDKAYTNGAEPESPVTIEPGQSLTLRYGLHVRDYTGDTRGAVDAYEKYIAVPR